jgi:peptide/nickel transport system substrate-binding protein
VRCTSELVKRPHKPVVPTGDLVARSTTSRVCCARTRWHDGSPFNAEDVLFTLKRVPDVPNSPSSFATFTKPIVEAKATDPHTLIFKTASPHVLLPSDMGSVYIVSKLHGEKATTADYNSGKAAIGTGPYKFVEYVPNQRVVLKANFGYWGGEEPWDKVTFKILTNSAGRVAALLSNDVQLIETVPTSDIARLAQDKKFALSDKVSNRVIYVHLNQRTDTPPPFVSAKDGKALEKNPFKDPRVRRALSMAINRDAIAERIMEKRSVPAAQLLPEFFPGTARSLPPKYDPEAAKKCSPRRLFERLRHDHPRAEQSLHQRRGPPGDRPVHSRGVDARPTMPANVLHPRHEGRVRYMVLGWGTESGEQGSSLRSLATHDATKGMGVITAAATPTRCPTRWWSTRS